MCSCIYQHSRFRDLISLYCTMTFASDSGVGGLLYKYVTGWVLIPIVLLFKIHFQWHHTHKKKEVIHSVLEVAHFVLLSSHAPVCQDICFLLRFTRLLWFSGRTKYWLFFITAGWPRSHGWRSRAVQISFPISLRWGLAAPCLGFRDFSATMKMFLVRLFEWYPFSALKLSSWLILFVTVTTATYSLKR